MLKIFVIEFFPENSQQRQKRREKWESLMAQYSAEASVQIAVPLLDNNGLKMNGKMLGLDGERFSIAEYDLIFIHESDSDNYLDAANNENIPFICYGQSSDKLEVDSIHKLQIQFIALPLLFENADSFFRQIVADQKLSLKAYHKLIGFDPVLEAKIVLLHACLLPESIYDLRLENFSEELQFAINELSKAPVKDIDDGMALPSNFSPVEQTVESLINDLIELQDNSSAKYVKLLLTLRKTILDNPLKVV